MKELLAAIKAALLTGITYVRPQDLYITPSLDLVPNGVRPPAIAIKDGPIARTEKLGGLWEVSLAVRIAVFAQVLKPEASLMGDTSTSTKGMLDMADDVHTVLDENFLSIVGMLDAFSPSEGESELVGDESEMFQRKIITYQYLKEEDRP